MDIKKKFAYLKNAVFLLIRNHEDDPDAAASFLVEAIIEGIDYTFDHWQFDRTREKEDYKICLLNGIINRLKGVKYGKAKVHKH